MNQNSKRIERKDRKDFYAAKRERTDAKQKVNTNPNSKNRTNWAN